MDVLIVVDMQNDFIDGTLGTKEAVAIVPNVVERIKTFKGLILATRDTHNSDYLSTQEGRKLPVEHCIDKTEGWCAPDVNMEEAIESITLIGLCTDICVISNA